MAFPSTQIVPIQFSGGLNSKIAAFKLDQPFLETCENATYTKDGQIDKRSGFTLLSNKVMGGGTLSAGASLTTFNGELLLLDGTNLYSWQSEEGVWINRGSVFSSVNSQVRVLNSKISTQSNPDVTTSNGISLYVWEDNRPAPVKGDGIRYSVYNNKTGTLVVSDGQLYIAGVRPKVLCDGELFFVFYVASAQAILSATVPVGAPNTVSSNLNVLLENGQSSNFPVASIPYDVCLYNGEPVMVFATPIGVSIGRPTSPGFAQQLLQSASHIQVISCAVDSKGILWIAWSDLTDSHVMAYFDLGGIWTQVTAPFVPSTTGPTIAKNIAMIADTQVGNMNVTFEIAIAGDENVNNHHCDNYLCVPSGKANFIGQMRGVGLASKPFRFGENLFINTIAQSNLQATYFTQCLTQGLAYVPGTANVQAANDAALATNFTIVSRHAPQNGGTYRTNALLSQCDAVDNAGGFVFAGQRKGAFTTWQNATSVTLGCAGYVIDLDNANAFNSVQSNNNLHIVGGVKKIYDGVSCVEDNFLLFPENYLGFGCTATLTNAGAGGNLSWNMTNPSQYQWAVVYEWTDNYGQVQRSAPSIAVTATTTAANQAAVLRGPTLRVTEKAQARSPVIVSIYRTQANLPIFYKVTDDNNPLVNDTTLDFWTFTDTLSDVAIAANENQYTGSQLPNSAPPPCSLISLYQQRLMINSTEDPDVVWYSQNKFEQDQYNTIALDFNTSFVEGVDSRYGNSITALGLLDNNLAIFKETSIFLLQGDGPNALDTSGQFNDAALLVSDTGCNNPNSLVFVTQTSNSPGGLLFKSPKGIYLLGRDQSLTYIGAPVEKYNDLTITSANLLAATNEIVFTTIEGTALVFNYFFNAWSTWSSLPAVDACVWEGQLCLLTETGGVMVQDTTGTVYADTHPTGVTYPVSLKIRTPFIKMSGMQGYQSVFGCYLLGTLQAPHLLQVTVAYDYNPSAQGSVVINSSLAGAGRWGGLPIWGSTGAWGNNGLFSNYQFQINVNNPRCQSIQFTFEDVQPEPSKGFSLNGLALEVLALPGPMRLPTKNQVGVS